MTDWKPIHDGAQYLARGETRSVATALALAAEMLGNPPGDCNTYPWRVEVQKSARGARYSVTVSVQVAGRERPPRPKPGPSPTPTDAAPL